MSDVTCKVSDFGCLPCFTDAVHHTFSAIGYSTRVSDQHEFPHRHKETQLYCSVVSPSRCNSFPFSPRCIARYGAC